MTKETLKKSVALAAVVASLGSSLGVNISDVLADDNPKAMSKGEKVNAVKEAKEVKMVKEKEAKQVKIKESNQGKIKEVKQAAKEAVEVKVETKAK